MSDRKLVGESTEIACAKLTVEEEYFRRNDGLFWRIWEVKGHCQADYKSCVRIFNRWCVCTCQYSENFKYTMSIFLT